VSLDHWHMPGGSMERGARGSLESGEGDASTSIHLRPNTLEAAAVSATPTENLHRPGAPGAPFTLGHTLPDTAQREATGGVPEAEYRHSSALSTGSLHPSEGFPGSRGPLRDGGAHTPQSGQHRRCTGAGAQVFLPAKGAVCQGGSA